MAYSRFTGMLPTLTLLDAPYPLEIYDGFEPDDYHQKVAPKATEPWLQFSFAELADLGKLRALIGEAAFAQIVARGIARPMADGPWVGAKGLCLHYAMGRDASHSYLTVVGFGEFQPARYRVVVESVWRVEGA